MVRTLMLGVTGLAWAIMMAALFQNEVLPYFEYQASPSYRMLLKDRSRPEFVVRSIYIGNEAVGQSRTMTYAGPGESRLSLTEFEMSLQGLLRMLGLNHQSSGADQISIVSKQTVNAAYQLESFKMTGRVLFPITIEGRRDGDKMKIQYQVSSISGTKELPFEKMAMLGGAYTPLNGVGRPVVGKKWKIQSLDPNILGGEPKIGTAFARIEEKEKIHLHGREVEAYRVDIRYRSPSQDTPDAWMWVDEQGEVLLEKMTIFNLSCQIVLDKREFATQEQVSRFVGQR